MIIISHRGNVNRPNTSSKENIFNLLNDNFYVELDVWDADSNGSDLFLYVGHEHENGELITINKENCNKLFLHAKTLKAFCKLEKIKAETSLVYKFFCHNEDFIAKIDNVYRWMYYINHDNRFVPQNTILVTNEYSAYESVKLLSSNKNFVGICTDYPYDVRKFLDGKKRI